MLIQKGAVRNADRIWVSTPQNRTLCVNLRKELVCSRAIHCASYIEEKRRNELRGLRTLIFSSFALFEMLIQKGAVRNADRIWVSTPQNRTLCVNLRKELVL